MGTELRRRRLNDRRQAPFLKMAASVTYCLRSRGGAVRLVAAIGLIVSLLIPIPAQASGTATSKPRLVVFDMELQDASHEGALRGIREDQSMRLQLISTELRSLLEQTDRFILIDHTPLQGKIEESSPLQHCNGCEGDIARELGADYALFGFVYKVSNLILEIHLYVRETSSGRIVASPSSSIRGNNDKSWLRGIRWMVKNRLLALDL